MKTKSFVNVAIFLMAGTFFVLFNAGCSKDEVAIDPAVPSIEEKNANLEILGEAFALFLNESEELRRLVTDKAMERITNDYDVPYFVIKDEIIGDRTVAESLANYVKSIAPDVMMDNLINNLHYMQLTIPILKVTEWNPNVPPSVVVVPVNNSDVEVEMLKAFSPNGLMFTICGEKIPSQQVIIIKESDRIDSEGKLMVNKNGIVVSKDHRVNFRDVLKIENKMKSSAASAYKGSNFLSIVSDDSLSNILKRAEHEQNELKAQFEKDRQIAQKAYKNSTKSSNNIVRSNRLVGFSNILQRVNLEWTSGGRGLRYTVIAYGDFPYGNTSWTIAQNLNRLSFVANFRGMPPWRSFNIQVIGKDASGNTVSESNFFTYNSSGRSNLCREYISKVFMTRSAYLDIKKWWQGSIKLDALVTYSSVPGSSNIYRRGAINDFYIHWENGRRKDTERSYGPNDFGLVTQWNKSTRTIGRDIVNNGVFNVRLYSYVSDRSKKTWRLPYSIITPKLLGDNEIVKVVIGLLEESYRVDDSCVKIGDYEVTWSTPQNTTFNIRSGVAIVHSYRN